MQVIFVWCCCKTGESTHLDQLVLFLLLLLLALLHLLHQRLFLFQLGLKLAELLLHLRRE
jgi:hypothetical protein